MTVGNVCREQSELQKSDRGTLPQCVCEESSVRHGIIRVQRASAGAAAPPPRRRWTPAAARVQSLVVIRWVVAGGGDDGDETALTEVPAAAKADRRVFAPSEAAHRACPPRGARTAAGSRAPRAASGLSCTCRRWCKAEGSASRAQAAARLTRRPEALLGRCGGAPRWAGAACGRHGL